MCLSAVSFCGTAASFKLELCHFNPRGLGLGYCIFSDSYRHPTNEPLNTYISTKSSSRSEYQEAPQCGSSFCMRSCYVLLSVFRHCVSVFCTSVGPCSAWQQTRSSRHLWRTFISVDVNCFNFFHSVDVNF